MKRENRNQNYPAPSCRFIELEVATVVCQSLRDIQDNDDNIEWND